MTTIYAKIVGNRVVVQPTVSAPYSMLQGIVETSEAAAQEAVDAVASAGIVANPALANHFIFGAGNGTATGTANIGVGPTAGQYVTTGSNNFVAGQYAGRDLFAGSNNVLIGHLVGYQGQGATGNVGIGANALQGITGARVSNIAIGRYAAQTYNGDEIVAIGAGALQSATGTGNTAIGTAAGAATTTGARQTIVGYSAQGGAANDDVIVMGHGASANKSRQIVFGSGTQREVKVWGKGFAFHNVEAVSTADGSPLDNYYLLRGEPVNTPTTGTRNISIGKDAGGRFLSATNNIAIGQGALELHTGTGVDGGGAPLEGEGNNTIAIGVLSAQMGEALADCVYIGVLSGQMHEIATGATVVGFRASQFGVGSANPTAIGDSALWVNKGAGNVGVGYVVAEYNQAADESVFIGRAAGQFRDGSSESVIIGHGAGGLFEHTGSINYTTGTGAVVAGDRVILVGHSAAREYLGGGIVAMGYMAARSLTATTSHLSNSVFLGNNSGNHASQKTDAVNCIALGDGTWTDADNQAVIGNSSIMQTVLRGVTRHTTYTVATLPSASAMGAGARAFVTDANSTTFNAIAAGGGGNAVSVFSDGANWRVG